MNNQRSRLKPEQVQSTTYSQRERAKVYLNVAKKLVEDPDRERRVATGECQICYYVSGRIGGAAITTANCCGCNRELVFSNTNTDVLCPDCAKTLRVCKHCGADLHLRNRRKVNIEGLQTVKAFPEVKDIGRLDSGSIGRMFILPKKNTA